MCQNFEIAPVLKMFVSWHHQQLPRYFSANVKDTRADGYNAFCYHCDSDVVMYMNPPWSLLDQIIDKIIVNKSTVLLVTPHWFESGWYKKLTKLRRERRRWNQSPISRQEWQLAKEATMGHSFIFIPGLDAHKTEE